MLTKNIHIPADTNSNDQARARNNMEEAKEEPMLIGRTPELSYSLHFTPTPSSNHPDAGFEILGISRDTLVTAFLNELTNCQNEDKRNSDKSYTAVKKFKKNFTAEIKTALGKGLLTDEKGLMLYEQVQDHYARLNAIKQRWQDDPKSAYYKCRLTAFLKNKLQDLTRELTIAQASISVNNRNDELEECKAEARGPQSLDEANKQLQLQQVQEDINSLQDLQDNMYLNLSLNDYCNDLFDNYIELLKKDLPLPINSMFHYARLKDLSIYLWEQDEQSLQHLVLKNRVLNKSNRQAPIHILFHHERLTKLTNHLPDIPLSLAENTVIENEMEQARNFISLTSENKLLTIESLLLEFTPLPKDLLHMIMDYQKIDNSLKKCIEENIIKFDSNTFWEDVVGRFPLISLYPFDHELIGAPDVELLATKLSNITESLKLFEPWAHAILLHHVKKLKASQQAEETADDDSKINFIGKLDRYGDGSADTKDSELVQLKEQLNSLSLDLLLMLLKDQNVLLIIQRYPRLQAVFLERTLKESPPFSEEVYEVIGSWINDVNDFVFYRIINSLLLNSTTSLAKVKMIPAIINRLSQNELDKVEEEHSFINTICHSTFRFINKELNQINADENSNRVFIKPRSYLPEVTQEFIQYCQAKDQIADWYIIYQYLITGVSVPNNLIVKLISQGHRQAIRAILQIPDIDANGGDYETFLMQAVWYGETEIVADLLAQAEINVNKICRSGEMSTDCYDYTALAKAVKYHQVEVVKLLLAVPGILIGNYAFQDHKKGKSEKGSIISLAFKKNDNECLKMKDYQLIQLLFQAEPLDKLTDKEFLKSFRLNNVLSTAAAISHDVVRCANLVIKMKGIVDHPDIIEFLLQIPGVNANKILINLAKTHYSERHEILFSKIVARPEITANSINKALLKLIKNVDYSAEKNNYHFAIAKILLTHPAINVNQAGLLAGALRYPEIARLLFNHPSLDKQNINHLLAERINQRITLVSDEFDKVFASSQNMSNNYLSAYEMNQDVSSNNWISNLEEYENVEEIFSASEEEESEISQQIVSEEEEIASDITYTAAELSSIFDSMKKAIATSDETTIKMSLPENVSLDKAQSLFWPIKRKQLKLIKEISLLTETRCLPVEDIMPLIEIAADAFLTDVLDVLLSTSQMQAIVYNYIENQHQASADKLNHLYRFFVDKKFINLSEYTLVAKCISLLAKHTDRNIAEIILSYINGKSANDNKVLSVFGAIRFSATGELNEHVVVDEIDEERYQASPR